MNPLDTLLIRELFRMSPYLMSTISVVLFFFLHDTELLFFAIGVYGCEISNHVLKHFIRSIAPSTEWFNGYIERPTGAVDCSCIIDTAATTASTPLGMPSGHCQASGFMVGYMWARVRWHQKQRPSTSNDLFHLLLTIIGGTLVLTMMAISRIGQESWLFNIPLPLPRIIVADINGCHTVSQTIVGTVVGLIMGMFWHHMFVVDQK